MKVSKQLFANHQQYVHTHGYFTFQKSGISFRVDNKRPSLVNLNEDPQLSEMLLYILKDGQTKIGQNKEGSAHDVKLCGPLIADNHW